MTQVDSHGRATHTRNRQLLKNAILISVAFMLLFTAYSGLGVLQSSLHHDEGMGVINQAILYAVALVSFLFLPKWIIYRIGHKRTLAFCMLGYAIWVAANGYAVWGTMVPASIIVGLCCAPLWTAKSSYLTLAAAKYASVAGEEKSVVIARFEGIFMCLFQLGGKYFAQITDLIHTILTSIVLTLPCVGININSLRPSDAYMRR